MSIVKLTNACPVCGAEESLDSIVARLIDDDQTRRLIADLLCHNLVIGGHVLRYLRLFSPAKQRLRMGKARAVLAELLPAIQSGVVTRKGREWRLDTDGWNAAFDALFRNADAGTLRRPLDSNAYLFEIVLRLADQVEAAAEQTHEAALRGRTHRSDAATDIAAVASTALQHRDPALMKLDADRAKAVPMPEAIRERISQLKKGAANGN